MPTRADGAEVSDEILMDRARRGETDAFAELYDRYSGRAFRVARAICHGHAEAERAVEEGFLAIWRDRKSHRRDGAGFQAWSMSVVEDRAIEASRLSAPPREDDDGHPLLAYLRRLPEPQAEVIVLAAFGGLSYAQIAAQLDLPAGAVDDRMRLGLEKLRRQI